MVAEGMLYDPKRGAIAPRRLEVEEGGSEADLSGGASRTRALCLQAEAITGPIAA